MSYEGEENLHILEESAPSYNRFLVRKFRLIFEDFGLKSNESVLDFGAGIGTLAKEFQNSGFPSIECLEIDPTMLGRLKLLGLTNFSSINELSKKYKYVYMSNVLEHIEDDVAILDEIKRQVLAPTGVVVIFVPAFQVLYSEMDEQVGHFRRYRKKSIRSAVESANLREVSCEYVDSVGFLALLVFKFVLRKNLRLESNVSLLRIYDRVIFPVSRFIDRLGARYFVGKNLLLVATQKDEGFEEV